MTTARRLASAPALVDLRSPARGLLVALGFVAVYAGAAELSETFGTEAGISPWYPAVGLSLAAALLLGRSAIPLIVLADLTQLALREPEFGAAAIGVLALVQGAVWGTAGLLLRRHLPSDYGELDVQELWKFSLGGAVAASLASSLIAVPVVVATQAEVSWDDYPELLRLFFIGDAVGVLTVTPALLALADFVRREGTARLRVARSRPAETAAMLVATVAVPAIGVIGVEQSALALTVLPLTWVALRRGIGAASIAMLLWSLAGALTYHLTDAQVEFEALASLMAANGLLALFTGTVVAERQRARRQLVFQATHDDSGMPNRDFFAATVGGELAARPPEEVSVIVVSAKRLGEIAADGPEVLMTVLAENVARIRATLADDGVLIARLAPGQLAVLAVGHTPTELDRLATQIKEALTPPVPVGPREYLALPVAGVATARAGDQPQQLIDRAGRAASAAVPKVSGTAHFDDAMHAREQAERELARDLQEAMRTGDGISLHYQPIVELRTGEIVGAEALVRWQHPERGNVPPADFIPVAERRGLILPLGRWILETACRAAAAWPAVGSKPLIVEVNLSPVQLRAEGITAEVRRALAETGLDASRLCLELTEGAVVDDFDMAVERLRELCDSGVQVVLDDFGTGHSSMQWLQRLPVQALKIDRSFVSGIEHQAVDLAIVTSTIGLARAMHMGVVAEGVETPAQLATLRRLGCPSIQGFLVCRPVPEPQFLAWLLAHAGGPAAH